MPVPMPAAPLNTRDERRALLESVYDDGLITAYTYVAGPGGKASRATWRVVTNDGAVHEIVSEMVPLAVAMLRAGHRPANTFRPTRRIPYRDVAATLGITEATLKTYRARGKFPNDLIQGVNRDVKESYADATCNLHDVIHWGRSHGHLDPDGRPHPAARGNIAKHNAAREAA